MKETYKDHEITYNEGSHQFSVKIGESIYSNLFLEKVRKQIDNLDKKDFTRVDVIYPDYSDKMREAVVTSLVDDDYNSYTPECWISFKGKKGYNSRRKVPMKSCILDTESNRQFIIQIDSKKAAINRIEGEISELREKLETYQG